VLEVSARLSPGVRAALVAVGVVGLLVGLVWLAVASLSSSYVGPPPERNADGTLSVSEGRPDTDFDIRSVEGTFPVGMEGEDVTVWRVQRATGEGLEELFRGSMREAEAYLRSVRDEARVPVFTGTLEEYETWAQSRQDEQWDQRQPMPMILLAASTGALAVGIWSSVRSSQREAEVPLVLRWVGLLVVVLGVVTLLYGLWQPREGSLVEPGAPEAMGDVDPDYVRVESLETRAGLPGEPARVGDLLFEGQREAAYLYLRIAENTPPMPLIAGLGLGTIAGGTALIAVGNRRNPVTHDTTPGRRIVIGAALGFVVGIAVSILGGWLYGLGALSYGFLNMGFLLPPAVFSLVGAVLGVAYRPGAAHDTRVPQRA